VFEPTLRFEVRLNPTRCDLNPYRIAAEIAQVTRAGDDLWPSDYEVCFRPSPIQILQMDQLVMGRSPPYERKSILNSMPQSVLYVLTRNSHIKAL
jgi:hypothetical protein